MTVVPTTPVRRAPVVSRRHLLLGGAALVAAAGTAGCGVLGDGRSDAQLSPTPSPDPLLDVARAARADAAAATQLAAVTPPQAVPLRTIAAERTAHAQALDAEITRAAGTIVGGPAPSETLSVPSSIPTSAPPATVAALRDSLLRNQSAAAELASTAPSYRAGMLGSVAAACASALVVLL